MKIQIQKSSERGLTAWGWLVSRHSFSFGDFYDPNKMHFGALRVLNDDLIMQDTGFPPHNHENMEIITIPIFGAVQHQDSTGGNGVIHSGEVQIMSAGTGVQHSEYNASAEERLELLQIWINPEQVGLPPRYEQKSFDLMHTENKWQTLASPSQEQGSLKIFQNAWISQVILESDARVDYELHDPKNGVYVFVIEGQIMITNNNGDDASKNTILSKRDAVGITETESLNVIAYKKSHILAIEVPM